MGLGDRKSINVDLLYHFALNDTLLVKVDRTPQSRARATSTLKHTILVVAAYGHGVHNLDCLANHSLHKPDAELKVGVTR